MPFSAATGATEAAWVAMQNAAATASAVDLKRRVRVMEGPSDAPHDRSRGRVSYPIGGIRRSNQAAVRSVVREAVGATAFERLLVRGTCVNPLQELDEVRPAGIEPGALGRRFEREAHLDVGRAELGAGE